MSVKQKRSQITLFLTLGIVIIIMVVFVLITSRYSVKKTLGQELLSAKEIIFDAQPIKIFVYSCLNTVSKDSLENFGENYTEDEIEIYVKNNIDACLDFSAFEEQGFNILMKEAKVDVSINENDVVFRMEYPIIIINPASREKTEIKDFIAKYNLIHEEI